MEGRARSAVLAFFHAFERSNEEGKKTYCTYIIEAHCLVCKLQMNVQSLIKATKGRESRVCLVGERKRKGLAASPWLQSVLSLLFPSLFVVFHREKKTTGTGQQRCCNVTINVCILVASNAENKYETKGEVFPVFLFSVGCEFSRLFRFMFLVWLSFFCLITTLLMTLKYRIKYKNHK